MKLFILTIIHFILVNGSYAQVKRNETYAIISIETNYDRPNKTYWYSIQPESVAQYSKEITSLVKYNLDKRTQPGIALYHERKDSASGYFNYFRNTTEAFQFLANHGWQLVDVSQKLISDYENVKDGEAKLVPVTKLSTIPVYYFKKEISKE